jgi:glycosyltransferase 2 family protein
LNIRKVIVYLLFLGLAVGMMWYLYKDISWENDVKPSLNNANWLWIGISFVIGYMATVMRGLRWNLMLEPMGYEASNWTNIHSVAFGYCMNNLIPRSGELARCTLLNRAEKIPVDKLIGTVILERIVDLILLALVMLLAFIVKADALTALLASGSSDTGSGKGTLLLYVFISGFLFLIVFWMLLRYMKEHHIIKRINTFIQGMTEGVKSIFKIKKQFLFWFYSLSIWALWLIMAYCSMSALRETSHLTFADTIFFMAAGSLGMIVPTPGGAGAFHGYNGESGRIYALISWALKTAFDILVGALGFLIVTSKKVKL